MTFCKLLKEKRLHDGNVIQAYECVDKYESNPYYEITISQDGIAYSVYHCAKSTWKRKFAELTQG